MMRAASLGGLASGHPVGAIRINREAGQVGWIEDYVPKGNAVVCKHMPTRKAALTDSGSRRLEGDRTAYIFLPGGGAKGKASKRFDQQPSIFSLRHRDAGRAVRHPDPRTNEEAEHELSDPTDHHELLWILRRASGHPRGGKADVDLPSYSLVTVRNVLVNSSLIAQRFDSAKLLSLRTELDGLQIARSNQDVLDYLARFYSLPSLKASSSQRPVIQETKKSLPIGLAVKATTAVVTTGLALLLIRKKY